MSHPANLSRSLKSPRITRQFIFKSIYAVLFFPFSFFLFPSPGIAHTVKTSENVGATFHIEPHHNPKAGEQTQAWFALTRQGGKLIPLEQCNCKLAVYLEPRSKGLPPLLEPSLKPISVEKYSGIPAAEIIFPQPGNYQLELSGIPQEGTDFKAFHLNYTVTVGAGVTPKASPQKALEDHPPQDNSGTRQSQSSSQWQIPAIALAGILGITAFWARSRRLK